MDQDAGLVSMLAIYDLAHGAGGRREGMVPDLE
jgi:hypothetical protein